MCSIGDQVEALTLGNRIAVMKDGRVEQFGTPDDIYERPATRFVAEFIGSPSMNMVSAQRAALSAGGKELVYGVRPENIELADQGLPGTFTIIEPTGPETYATVDTSVGKLTARVPGNLRRKAGDAVCLRWNPAHAHLFDAASDKGVA